ncbi:MAG: antitoxin of toxin-antitoxin stability system [Gammaproteobacteria bacterium]|nr:antitoxin of toxin-antitoxin stability system [Gammaproteobacteria bacterium]
MLNLPVEYEVTRDRIFKMRLPESVEPGKHRFIVTIDPPPAQARQPGSAKGRLILLCEDETHLADFADYMP